MTEKETHLRRAQENRHDSSYRMQGYWATVRDALSVKIDKHVLFPLSASPSTYLPQDHTHI